MTQLVQSLIPGDLPEMGRELITSLGLQWDLEVAVVQEDVTELLV